MLRLNAHRQPARAGPCRNSEWRVSQLLHVHATPRWWTPHRRPALPPGSAVASARTQEEKSDSTSETQHTKPVETPLGSLIDAGPAQSAQDFGVTATELQDLVQDAFSCGRFSRDSSSLAEQLRTSHHKGLDGMAAVPSDSQLRQQLFGVNMLRQPPAISFWQLVWDALQDRTLVLLIAAGAVSFLLAATLPEADSSEWIEGVAILASVLIVVSVSAVTNYQKESKFRVLNALKDNIQVRVIRGGVERPVLVQDLLVGDILVVETGDILPADGVLVAGEDLRLDESHMTGESEDVVKSVRTDKTLMLAGSKVREGYGRMLVLAVGERSQQGVLQSMVLAGAGKSVSSSTEGSLDNDGGAGSSEAEGKPQRPVQPMVAAAAEQTLLTQKLERLADLIGNVGLGVAGFVTGISSLAYTVSHVLGPNPVGMVEALKAYLDFFITGVTIVVVAVPEGLPLAVTLALAFSVQRMLKDNNLVRHLDACETMASATTICSDKTGTLTANEMCVVRAWAGGEMYTIDPPAAPAPGATALEDAKGCGCDGRGLPPRLLALLQQGVQLNCTASIRRNPDSGELEKIGNRTECALLEWATEGGELPVGQDGSLVLQTLPFTSDRKRMSALVVLPEVVGQLRPRSLVPCRLLTKGGAEVVLDRCTHQLTSDGHVVPLSPAAKQLLLEPFTRQGLRVLALTQRDISLPSHVLSWVNKGPGGKSKPVPAAGLQMPADILEDNLVLVGLLGLQDPLRPDVPLAIKQCQRAGIVVRMLTGDNSRTAANIASECGILAPNTDIDAALAASTHLVDSLLARRQQPRSASLAAAAATAAATAMNQLGSADVSTSSSWDGTPTIPTMKSPVANRTVDQGIASTGSAKAGNTSVLPVQLQSQLDPVDSDWEAAASSSASSSRPAAQPGQVVRPRRQGRMSSLDSDVNEDELYSVGLASRSYDHQDEWGQPHWSVHGGGKNSHSSNNSGASGAHGSTTSMDTSARTGSATGNAVSSQPGNESRQASGSVTAGSSSKQELVAGLSTSSGEGNQTAAWTSSDSQPGNGASEDLHNIAQRALKEVLENQGNVGGSASASAESVSASWDAGAEVSAKQNGRPKASAGTQQPVTADGQAGRPAPQPRQGQQEPQAHGAAPSSPAISTSATTQSPSSAPAWRPNITATSTTQAARVATSASSIATHSSQSASSSYSGASSVSSLGNSASSEGPSTSGEGWADLGHGAGRQQPWTDSASLPLVLEGPQFRALVQKEDGTLDLESLREIWPRLRVIARCSPADKYLLVTGLKLLRQQEQPGPQGATSSGSGAPASPPPLREVICMTGDGTNDAPALSAADVGFAMNSGTSIAKDAADILLMDNSFSSIVSAVKWGRNVYASVTKFLQFQLTANVVAVITAGAGALLVAHSPLSAVQMLWVNLMMDSLASLALATEAPTDDLLDLPPVPADQPLITPVVAKHILGQAAAQLVVLAALVLHGKEWFHVDVATLDTIIFNSFVCMQLFNQINCRKVRDEPDILSGVLHHPTFCAIVGAEALLQVAIVQLGGPAFQTRPLTVGQWAACVGLGATTLLLREALRKVPVAGAGVTGGALQRLQGLLGR